MNVEDVIKRAQEEFSRLSKLPVNAVIGLAAGTDGKWSISLETVERKAIPDTMDVLGIYEVCIDCDGHLVGFERKKLRKRGETEES